MDQDSSNGGGERRNWRERLGIAKEPPKASSQPLPKLAGEFKPASAQPAQGATAPRAEPRLGAAPARPATAAQPGAAVRPAPMAPRPGQPVRPGTAPSAPARPAAAQASRQAPAQTAQRPPAPAAAAPPQPAAPRPAAPAPGGAASDEFADRLRKQREAAEKLAQQRAEARAQQLAAGAQPAAPSAAASSAEAPRFTFAPEELEQAPPLAAAPSVAQPVSRPQGQWAPGYPPLPAPPPGGYQRPSTAYPYGQPYNPQNRPGAPRPGAYPPPEGWARPGAAPGGVYTPAYQPPEPPGGPDAEGVHAEDVPYPDHLRPAPRPRPPAPAQRRLPPPPAEDDVFEAEPEARPVRRQPPPPRGRGRELAAPQRSYTEYDEDYDEAPRRRGPLWLLLGLLAVALLAGGMLWAYYQYAGRTAGGQTGEIPVIAPSEQPVKATPDPATAPQQQGGSVTQPQGRKQIYDRILGEDTVEPARVVPTEEQPVPPAPAPAAPPAATAPEGGEVIEPAPVPPPVPGQQGGTGQPEPLPLPPPPGQQGSVEPPAASPTVQAAAASASESGEQIVQSATGAAGTPAPAVAEDQPALPPPPKKKAKVAAPEPDTEAIVSAPETPAPAVENGAVQTGALSPPDPAQAAVNEPLPLPPAPQLPAAAPQPAPAQQGGLTGLISQIGSQFGAGGSDTAAAPAENQPRKRSIRDEDPLEGTRVPLNATGVAQAPAQQPQDQQVALNLPPAPDQAAPQAAPEAQESLDAGQAFAPQAPAPAPAPAQQQGGFLQNLQRNLGLGTGTRQPATVVTGGQQAADQQVAALPPATATAPAPAIPAGGGFQVQLASFTSQGEAESEFQRLKQRHPGLLGSLQPRIQPADLGSLGTRYRLGVAPLGSREQAAKLCNSLIAAGVRDCTVRAF